MSMVGPPVGAAGQGHSVGPGQQGPVMGPVIAAAGLGPSGGPAVLTDDQAGVSVGGGPLKGGSNKGPGTGGGVFLGHPQRSTPYPNPQQYMQSKRAQFVNGQTPTEVIVLVKPAPSLNQPLTHFTDHTSPVVMVRN